MPPPKRQSSFYEVSISTRPPHHESRPTSARSCKQGLLKGEAEDSDNGLQVTLHLKEVETLVCVNRDLKAIQVFEVIQVPA